MNEERETGMGCMAALVLCIVIAVLAMCSCSGRKVITETIVTRDTIHITHSDTVSIDRWLTHHDTLRIETERVVTLVKDTVGRIDTVRVESNTFHWQHKVRVEGRQHSACARLPSRQADGQDQDTNRLLAVCHLPAAVWHRLRLDAHIY